MARSKITISLYKMPSSSCIFFIFCAIKAASASRASICAVCSSWFITISSGKSVPERLARSASKNTSCVSSSPNKSGKVALQKSRILSTVRKLSSRIMFLPFLAAISLRTRAKTLTSAPRKR